MAYVPGIIDTDEDINVILWFQLINGEWYKEQL